MDEKMIREAVKHLEFKISISKQTGFNGKDARIFSDIKDFLNSYLSAIEEGVPEEKPATVMIAHTTGEAGVIIEHPTADIYAEGWNALRKIMLPLLAKLKMENEELKKYSQGQQDLINKETQKRVDLEATLAEKDREIEILQRTPYNAELKLELQKKDQRIAELEEIARGWQESAERQALKTAEVVKEKCKLFVELEKQKKLYSAVNKERIK